MNKITAILFFMCVLSISPAYGEGERSDSGDVVIPPGMEVIKEGDVNVVVPKGGRLRKQDSVMLIETADEYASRKFADTDNKFEKIEKKLGDQEKELEYLKIAVKKLEEDGRKK